MSRKRMPGFGKSGISRILRFRSSTCTALPPFTGWVGWKRLNQVHHVAGEAEPPGELQRETSVADTLDPPGQPHLERRHANGRALREIIRPHDGGNTQGKTKGKPRLACPPPAPPSPRSMAVREGYRHRRRSVGEALRNSRAASPRIGRGDWI